MRNIWPGGTLPVTLKTESGKGGIENEKGESSSEGMEAFSKPYGEDNEPKP
jgi:hypothetical protein